MERRVNFFSFFHHLSNILFAQFFHPCEDEKNIHNGVVESVLDIKTSSSVRNILKQQQQQQSKGEE